MWKEKVLARIQDNSQLWVSKNSFSGLAKEAASIELSDEVGELKFLYRDIIIDISLAEEYPLGKLTYAKLVRVQKITSDYVKIPSKVLYEFSKASTFKEDIL